MNTRTTLVAAALFGLTAVMLGAFGAHALKGYLPAGLLKAWNTAVLYQFVHTLGLLAIAMFLVHQPGMKSLRIAATCFTAGILLFSGSLYILALTQIGKLGIITPFGGVMFMLGWAALIVAGWKWPANPPPQSPSN